MGNGSGEAEKIDSEVGEIDLLKGEGGQLCRSTSEKIFFEFLQK